MENNGNQILIQLKENLKEKIGNNLESALLILDKELKTDTEIYNQYIICKNQIKQLESSIQIGILGAEEKRVQYARNLNNILIIINKLQLTDLNRSFDHPNNQTPLYLPKKSKWQHYSIFVIPIAILILSIYFIWVYAIKEHEKLQLTESSPLNSAELETQAPFTLFQIFDSNTINKKESKTQLVSTKSLKSGSLDENLKSAYKAQEKNTTLSLIFTEADQELERIARNIIIRQLSEKNILIKNLKINNEESKVIQCAIKMRKEEIVQGFQPVIQIDFSVSITLFDESKNITSSRNINSEKFNLYKEYEIELAFDQWFSENSHEILPSIIEKII